MEALRETTDDASPSDEPPAAVGPTVLPVATRFQIFRYLGGLIVLLAFADPNGGLMDIPISFFLKNKLHLSAHEMATFRVFAATPLYLSFLFGLARDNWNPLGMRDRGLIAIFGFLGAALYATFAFIPVTYASLLAAVMLVTTCFLFVSSAQNGLSSTLGQQHAMSGQISAIWNIFASLPAIVALLIGGQLSNLLETHDDGAATRMLFFVGAATTALVAAYALLKPKAVFENIKREHVEAAQPFHDLRLLLRHRPIYPALGIWLLWNFAPGSTTPLQYYLQNTLNADDSSWGTWNAIFAASFIPTFLVFGALCQRVSLKKLLWWGTIVAIPQFVPLLFVHSTTGALIAAASPPRPIST